MIRALFLDHPNAVGESYGEHFFKASRFGIVLMRTGAACLLHAVVPALHQDTASRTVSTLANDLSSRRRIAFETPRGSPEAASFTAACL